MKVKTDEWKFNEVVRWETVHEKQRGSVAGDLRSFEGKCDSVVFRVFLGSQRKS